ncbi:skin secretory protein xP2-like [Muntiacus reevesi]|uniref:skin secretory protein xP2-like n=1 Tax=Muntiacus reevesi TaxID=9886 RepID=UPI0033072FF6
MQGFRRERKNYTSHWAVKGKWGRGKPSVPARQASLLRPTGCACGRKAQTPRQTRGRAPAPIRGDRPAGAGDHKEPGAGEVPRPISLPPPPRGNLESRPGSRSGGGDSPPVAPILESGPPRHAPTHPVARAPPSPSRAALETTPLAPQHRDPTTRPAGEGHASAPVPLAPGTRKNGFACCRVNVCSRGGCDCGNKPGGEARKRTEICGRAISGCPAGAAPGRCWREPSAHPRPAPGLAGPAVGDPGGGAAVPVRTSPGEKEGPEEEPDGRGAGHRPPGGEEEADPL